MDLKKFFFIIFLLVIVGCVNQGDKDLSTSLYGKVIQTESEIPAAGTTVTAKYVTKFGIEKTVETKTLDESYSEELVGYYFFNRGQLRAKENTTITITCQNITNMVMSSPGRVVRSDIFVGYIPDKSRESSETITGDIRREEHLPSLEEKIYRFRIPEPSAGTIIFGQLLDDMHLPVGGKEIIMEWSSVNDTQYNSTSRTLTIEEAGVWDNESLEGYYWFEEIDAKPGSIIKIRTKDGMINATLIAKPGEKIRRDIWYTSEMVKEMKKEAFMAGIAKGIQSVRDNMDIYSKILLSILLVIVFILVFKNRKKIEMQLRKIAINSGIVRLRKTVGKFTGQSISTLMKADVITVDKSENLKSAVDTILSQDVYSVIVTDGKKPAGMMTIKDIVRRVIDKKGDLSKFNVADVMSAPLKTVKAEASLIDAMEFAVKNQFSKIPVVKDGRLVGVLTKTDLLRKFDEFIKMNVFGSVPLVRSIFEKGKVLIVDKEDLVVISFKRMLQEDKDIAVIIKKEEIIGFISDREILYEMYKNPLMLERLKNDQIMNEGVFLATPGTEIFDANKTMLENNIKRLIVISDKKVRGIVTQADVLRAAKSFLEGMIHKKKEELSEVIKLDK